MPHQITKSNDPSIGHKMTNPRPLRLALPRSIYGEQALDALQAVGLAGHEKDGPETPDSDATALLGCGLTIHWLHPDDIPIYVDHGVVDLGVARTEVLYEAGVMVYRPYTFPFGSRAVALITPTTSGLKDLARRPLVRVATRYRRFAKDRFAALGWTAELIPLAGSLHVAPGLGLVDAIIDVVEDDEDLARLGLHTVARLGETQVKLITNRASSSRRMHFIEKLVAHLCSR